MQVQINYLICSLRKENEYFLERLVDIKVFDFISLRSGFALKRVHMDDSDIFSGYPAMIQELLASGLNWTVFP